MVCFNQSSRCWPEAASLDGNRGFEQHSLLPSVLREVPENSSRAASSIQAYIEEAHYNHVKRKNHFGNEDMRPKMVPMRPVIFTVMGAKDLPWGVSGLPGVCKPRVR